MSFRLTLDGQNFPDPVEWQDTTITKEWNDDVFDVSADITYTFIGTGYDYLLAAYDDEFCSQVTAKIYICDELKYVGKIFLSEITVDRVRCEISATISDQGYRAFIKNKERQPYVVNIGRASDGTSITAATPVDVDFHNVTDGSYYADAIECYDAFDVLEFLVTAMSDGQMGFESDFFSTGEGFGDVITTGAAIRKPTSSNPAPEISWSEVYGSLKTIWNLAIDVIDVSGVQTVKVEPYSYFRQFGVSQSFVNIPSIIEEVDSGSLYSVIEIGSSNALAFDAITPNVSFPPIEYIGWENETYNVSGQCVVSNELSLVVQGVIMDSNSIEAQLNNPGYSGVTTSESTTKLIDSAASFDYTTQYRVKNTITNDVAYSTGTDSATQISLNTGIFSTGTLGDSYEVDFQNATLDGKNFIVRTETGYSTRQTVQYDPIGSGLYFYNGIYSNDNVLSNWTGRIHNSAFRYTTGVNADFEALTSADQEIASGCDTTTAYWAEPADACGYGPAIPFDNVTFNPGGYYDGVTDYVYQLPAAGTYLFQVDYNVDVTISQLIQSPKGPDLIHTIRTHFYEDTGAVEIGTRDFTFEDFRPDFNSGPAATTRNFVFSHFFAYSGITGDKVRPYIEFFNNVPLVQLGSYANFLTGCTFKSRGLIANPNSALKNYTTEVPITAEEWTNIEDNPYQLISLNEYQGHIKSIEWKPFGISSIQLEKVINQ